jgi:hypothetical protein
VIVDSAENTMKADIGGTERSHFPAPAQLISWLVQRLEFHGGGGQGGGRWSTVVNGPTMRRDFGFRRHNYGMRTLSCISFFFLLHL